MESSQGIGLFLVVLAKLKLCDGFAVDFIGAVGSGAAEWYKAAWTRWGS